MHAIDLITQDIPPLRPKDDVGRALDWMEEFKVGHLPVVDNGRLVGMVKDQDLIDRNDPHGSVASVMEQVEIPFIRNGQHIYEVMKLFSERGLTVLPVVIMATGVTSAPVPAVVGTRINGRRGRLALPAP